MGDIYRGGIGAEAGSALGAPDNIMLQGDSLRQTREELLAKAQQEEAERQAALAAKETDRAERQNAYEAALQSDEYANLTRKYGADTASQIIGRRMYPEEAKTFDNAGKAVFTGAFPEAAIPIISFGDTLRAWKANEGRGRDAQITAATGALMGDLSSAGLSTVFGPMRPIIRYPGQVASGVVGGTMKENSQQMAEGKLILKDSSDVWPVTGELATEEAMKKAAEVLASRVINAGRWR